MTITVNVPCKYWDSGFCFNKDREGVSGCVGGDKCEYIAEERMKHILQNGNDGLHYEEVDKMSGGMDKDESCFGCVNFNTSYDVLPCNECLRAFSGNQKDWYVEDKPGAWVEVPNGKTLEEVANFFTKNPTDCLEEEKKLDKEAEKEYLTKLIDDHWAYIEKLLEAHDTDKDIIEVAKFHYKSAFRHGFKHALEWVEEGK